MTSAGTTTEVEADTVEAEKADVVDAPLVALEPSIAAGRSLLDNCTDHEPIPLTGLPYLVPLGTRYCVHFARTHTHTTLFDSGIPFYQHPGHPGPRTLSY